MNYFQALMCPYVIFKTRVGDDKIVGGGCAIGGAWKDVTTEELFNNKRIIIFSLPAGSLNCWSSTIN